MSNLWQGFLLGNAAILTNVCVLPLYPGMVAWLAAQSPHSGRDPWGRWLGVAVFAGIVSVMFAVGLLLWFLQGVFSDILPWFLPAVYVVVLALGIAMLLGKNPFAGLAISNLPVARNRFGGAFVYGMLLGPMTLPCAGPIIVTALLVGAGNATRLADGFAYFLAFSLGFGWPLILLPLVASGSQRQFTRWTTIHHTTLTRVSGVLLIAISLFGFYAEVLPNLGAFGA